MAVSYPADYQDSLSVLASDDAGSALTTHLLHRNQVGPSPVPTRQVLVVPSEHSSRVRLLECISFGFSD
jgi:hypothetical protein